MRSGDKLMDNTTIKDAKAQLRINQLKIMDEFIHSVNDEELMEDWLSYGVPDEASEDDYRFIAENDDLYMDCARIFKKTSQDDDCYY